jgi:hypothetical protein
MYFANASNGFEEAAKRTVNHILSYMRSSPTWAYHGGSRSWGDLGNNGKWMPSVDTASNFETRGNMHYRSGLNAIPLIEWYRRYPDDYLLLEIAMGSQAGQLMNIDEHGAPSMMMHMLPHILDYDPHSGDFGLGFFGHTLEAGAYYVEHTKFGKVCFLCDIQPSHMHTGIGIYDNVPHDTFSVDVSSTATTFKIRDSYRKRVFVEPVAIYVELDTGTIETVTFDPVQKTIILNFTAVNLTASFSVRRVRLSQTSTERQALNVTMAHPPSAKLIRGAYEFPYDVSTAVVSWQ